MQYPMATHSGWKIPDGTNPPAHDATLRDMFAMHALVGILSGPMNMTWENMERAAADAWEMADKMMGCRT